MVCRGLESPAESPQPVFSLRHSPVQTNFRCVSGPSGPKRRPPRLRARIEILGSYPTAGCVLSLLHSPFPSMSSEEKDKPSPSPNRPLSWLKPKQDIASITSTGDPTAINVNVAKAAEDDLKPISFFGLFRSVFISVFVPFHLRFLHRLLDSLLVQRSYSMPSRLLPQWLLVPPRSVSQALFLVLFHLPYSSLPG